jgi:hypothetical protein
VRHDDTLSVKGLNMSDPGLDNRGTHPTQPRGISWEGLAPLGRWKRLGVFQRSGGYRP